MRLLRFFTLILATGLLWQFTAPRLAAQDSVPPGSTPLAANAAVQYWQAIVQMPALDKDQEKLLLEDWHNVEAWQKVPLDPAAQKLIADSHNSLLYLQRGAQLKQCDWGLDYRDGISMLMPHLSKSRDLARLAALRARYNFEQRNWKLARNDATAIMALARHVGRDPIMISMLVRIGLEGIVVDVVAPYVPQLKASHADAVAMFEAMPPAATLQQSIVSEKENMARWIIKKLKEEEQRQPGAGLKLWQNFLEGADVPDSIRKPDSLDETFVQMEKLLPVYDDLARLVALSNDQFDAQYPAFKQKTKDENPLAGTLLPAIDQIRAKEQRSQARLAMLLAAIAFVEGGEAKLKAIKDPFGDGPFEYRALDEGFELASKLKYEDKPVTLVVGQRNKP
jgi:hypothetical protein